LFTDLKNNRFVSIPIPINTNTLNQSKRYSVISTPPSGAGESQGKQDSYDYLFYSIYD
jgi:hypothetical protein